ncbi:MmgE/PrpD family protein [Paraburkholderia unamae]|uniref:MmgE/PrpD family protein n=1 Tax=Paraburkholderia unamae TaxID=219649 RepID=UPI001CAE1EF3|nr:MmgE/PrpD family protein [Paraburkholderia unamae]CAG9272962.1 MmgE/PrpD family protein [Paraburkholderia unamae]
MLNKKQLDNPDGGFETEGPLICRASRRQLIMTIHTDIAGDFADFVSRARFEDIPEDAVEAAKKSILDTLGVVLAASGVEPAVRGLTKVAMESGGGTAESTILGFGGRAPAMMAAFANGAMAHCLDFDDHAPEGHHPSSSIVPAAFALAERVGGIPGREMITAVAAGQDLFLRLRRNVGWKQDWHLTTVLGVFSATASAGRILSLSKQQLANAFGIASMQSCGTMELAYGVGSDLRGMYAGFSSKGAVLAALLAERDISGIKTVFEGKAGIFNIYFDGRYDKEKMLVGLGNDYAGGSILYKPWPSCGASHPYIHATIELMKDHGLASEDLEQIRVHVGDFQNRLCLPLESRRKPATLADAKFSIPFCVAVAATRRQVSIADFTGERLTDPRVLATAQKVVPVLDERFDWKMKLPEGRVDILTRDGRAFCRTADDVPGGSDTPMTWDYIFDKFSDCASFSVAPPSREAIERVREMCRHLESLDDVTDVMRVLAGDAL